MPGPRPDEPIAPNTIPGEPTDPKIPPEQSPPDADPEDAGEVQRQMQESQAAFGDAIARMGAS